MRANDRATATPFRNLAPLLHARGHLPVAVPCDHVNSTRDTAHFGVGTMPQCVNQRLRRRRRRSPQQKDCLRYFRVATVFQPRPAAEMWSVVHCPVPSYWKTLVVIAIPRGERLEQLEAIARRATSTLTPSDQLEGSEGVFAGSYPSAEAPLQLEHQVRPRCRQGQ